MADMEDVDEIGVEQAVEYDKENGAAADNQKDNNSDADTTPTRVFKAARKSIRASLAPPPIMPTLAPSSSRASSLAPVPVQAPAVIAPARPPFRSSHVNAPAAVPSRVAFDAISPPRRAHITMRSKSMHPSPSCMRVLPPSPVEQTLTLTAAREEIDGLQMQVHMLQANLRERVQREIEEQQANRIEQEQKEQEQREQIEILESTIARLQAEYDERSSYSLQLLEAHSSAMSSLESLQGAHTSLQNEHARILRQLKVASYIGSATAAVWACDSHCANCSRVFSMFKRRHHCRSCGDSVCSNAACSKDKAITLGVGPMHKPVRACMACIRDLEEKKKQMVRGGTAAAPTSTENIPSDAVITSATAPVATPVAATASVDVPMAPAMTIIPTAPPMNIPMAPPMMPSPVPMAPFMTPPTTSFLPTTTAAAARSRKSMTSCLSPYARLCPNTSSTPSSTDTAMTDSTDPSTAAISFLSPPPPPPFAPIARVSSAMTPSALAAVVLRRRSMARAPTSSQAPSSGASRDSIMASIRARRKSGLPKSIVGVSTVAGGGAGGGSSRLSAKRLSNNGNGAGGLPPSGAKRLSNHHATPARNIAKGSSEGQNALRHLSPSDMMSTLKSHLESRRQQLEFGSDRKIEAAAAASASRKAQRELQFHAPAAPAASIASPNANSNTNTNAASDVSDAEWDE